MEKQEDQKERRTEMAEDLIGELAKSLTFHHFLQFLHTN